MLDTALEYARHSWPVFPLEPQGKQPLGRLVAHGLKDATVDEDVVRAWWKAEPLANIAIPTGIIFDVADFDTGEAMERFAELCHEHDCDPKTFPRAKTGRGGRHLFMAPTGVGNRTDVISGMDWRGKGGYVVVPNSIHPSGTTYEWIQQPEAPLPDCPPWLLALITKPMVVKPTAVSQDAPEPYIKAAVDGELVELRGAAAGTRNDSLNRSAYALGQMVGAGWILRGRAEAELTAAAYATGLEEPEVRRTIQSGLEDGIAHPRTAPPEGWSRGGEIRRTSAAASAATAAAVAPILDGPWLTPLATWLTQPEQRLDWLIDGILIRGGVGVVGAKPKVGKTTLLHQLALSVARGVQFLNRKTQSGPVIYLALEEDRGRVIARFRALKATPKDEIHLLVGQAGPEGLQKLAEAIKDLGATLAIIDPIQRLTRLENINDYAEVSNATDPLIGLARQTGCAIIFSHHLGKLDRESGDQLLGSTALFGAVDTSVVIRKQEDGARTLETIQRYGRSLEPVVLGHDEDSGAAWIQGPAEEYEHDRDKRTILKALDEQMDAVSQSELLNGLPLRWDHAIRALKGLVESHQVQRVGTGRRGDPYRFRGLTKPDDFRGTFISQTVSLPELEMGNETGNETTKEGSSRVSLPNTNRAQTVSLPYSGKESGKETGNETGFLNSQDSLPPLKGAGNESASESCPSCGKVDYEPMADERRRCVCGQVWS